VIERQTVMLERTVAAAYAIARRFFRRAPAHGRESTCLSVDVEEMHVEAS
jgi:hypothetical protein